MDLIALVFLTLVGYSTGAVLGGRNRVAFPGLVDLGLIVTLWTAALFSHSHLSAYLGRWLAVGMWLIVAGLFAFVRTRARRRKLPPAGQLSPIAERGLIRRLWTGWKRFAQQMGSFQGRVLLAMFYFIVITPFGVLVRLFSDPLRLKRRARTSSWLDRPAMNTNLESLRDQF